MTPPLRIDQPNELLRRTPADNWTTCPRCQERAMAEFAREDERVTALYGKVTVEEFEAERKALSERDFSPGATFREDYEFWGAEEGEVQASYSGVCTECHLTVELKGTKRFWPVHDA